MISIAGLDKAEVLAALYNASRPQGMGFFQAVFRDATSEEMRQVIAERGEHLRFDYLQGRVMKVDISDDDLDPRLYDRDNGQGAAARAIKPLRKSEA